ncbi:HNH endonuclease [Idiomarina loihiensis]|uniref:HNH endonuclease n=1 Tax=Idiomarina loihiensis TaxID=135577 RepID=UPI0039BE96F5
MRCLANQWRFIQHHAKGGKNDLGNLITLCNICHDEVHRNKVPESDLTDLLTSVQGCQTVGS